MKIRQYLSFTALLVIAVVVASPVRAGAGLPSEDERDILIISTLLRFNDANLSGDYSVLRARASRPFREQNSEKVLADAFKVFRDQGIDLAEVAIREINPDENGETEHGGVVRLSGYMDLSAFRLAYVLRFFNDGSAWELLSINVDVKS